MQNDIQSTAKDQNKAISTVARFLGIKTKARSFRAFRSSLKKANRPAEYPESYVGEWTFKDLVKRANNALKALDSCVHQSKSHLKHWTIHGFSWADQTDWADLRFFGPVISSANGWCNVSGKIDFPGFLPSFVLGAVDFDYGKEKKKDDAVRYIFIAIHRLDAFPAGIAAKSDGFPYYAQIVDIFKDGPVSTQYCFTLDRQGVIHDALHRFETKNRVRLRNRRFGNSKTGAPISARTVDLPQTKWRTYDPILEIGKHEKVKDPLTSKQIVSIAFNQWFQMDGSIVASFSDKRGKINVPIKTEDAKRLFKKRIKVKTKSGRTKPIVHWVSSHFRVNGSAVKTHWRGLRRFDWMGMQVDIQMPGDFDRPLMSSMRALRQGSDNWASKYISKVLKLTNACGEEVEFDVSKGNQEPVGLYYRPKKQTPLLH